LWPAELPPSTDVRAMLNRFDHVVVGFHRTPEVLAPLLRSSVAYLPHAVDVCRFVGGVNPLRTIDVYAMGRRNPRLHEVLLEREERTGRLYLYDTFCGNPEINDPREHRRRLAGLLRSSNAFLVNAARVDDARFAPADSDINFRYFEGVAGGAVLVGALPATELFAELFPWAESVVAAAADGSDLEDVLDDLEADPGRVAAIRRDNVVGALRHHDIAHRLVTLFGQLDLEIPPSVTERIRRLEALAAEVDAAPDAAPGAVPASGAGPSGVAPLPSSGGSVLASARPHRAQSGPIARPRIDLPR
jgi:hypothetical protein